MNLVGQRFGHIRVSGVVGQGGMGEVYAGYDETLERKVALKILHDDYRLDDEARERLLREARALSRLDHPNICRIHDYIDNGESDLLVLEFIDGKTLDEVHGTRAEKLRIAISIAGVLVAAHRAGIVHRDLKPENVMLTNAGEVKVLDFGLARWLNRSRSSDKHKAAVPHLRVVGKDDAPADETSPYPSSPPPFEPIYSYSDERELLATAAGTTVGTPIYMSPEQARGEPLSPASDMFSFGLVLQALFSGAEAHTGVNTAQEVMLRVARGVTDPVQNVPRDIAALINRLKALAPADRPTAVETLERLQWLADRPRRFTRRGLVAAVALFTLIGAWRYTVDLQRERAAAVAAEATAVEARGEADRRRGQAEDLIDFMMGDLHHKLAPIGRLDVLDAAADRALAYGASLRPELLSATELARNATALQHVGEVRMAQGKLPEALRAFEHAAATARQAVAKDPKNLDARFTLGQTQFYVGESHRQMGNKSGALVNMRDYLVTSEALARAAPKNLDYQVELAYGYSNIGSLLEAEGDYAGALQQYERCVAVKRARLRTNPLNRDWQGDLAQTINKIGSALLQMGRLDDARARFAEENGIYASLVASDPNHTQWETQLITSHAYLAMLLLQMGDLAASEGHYAAADKMASRLVEFDPANVAWRRNLAAVLWNAALLYRNLGRIAEARPRAERAEKLMRDVVRDAPQMTTWRVDLAMATMRHADVLLAAGAAGAAKSRVDSVLASVPAADDRAWLGLNVEASLLSGRIAAAQGRSADARAQWERVAQMLASLPVAPRNVNLLDYRARALLLLGRNAEAAPILDQLARVQYAHPDLVRLPRVAAGAKS